MITKLAEVNRSAPALAASMRVVACSPQVLIVT